MLDAAIALINRAGLTVSLDHLSFEDVIRDARVSRSTVYRRWPYKDLFFSDLLVELALAATPAAVSSEVASAPLLRGVVLDHRDWLDSAEGRRALLLELMRQGSHHDFEMMLGSTEWRTYLALHATFLSVADETLRDELRVALARSERDFVGRVAASWQLIAELFGYRLRPELGARFETVAAIASADLRGQVLMALAVPELATTRLTARPFGASQAQEWAPSALGLAGLAMAFLEPDPEVAWDAARVARVTAAFEAMA